MIMYYEPRLQYENRLRRRRLLFWLRIRLDERLQLLSRFCFKSENQLCYIGMTSMIRTGVGYCGCCSSVHSYVSEHQLGWIDMIKSEYWFNLIFACETANSFTPNQKIKGELIFWICSCYIETSVRVWSIKPLVGIFMSRSVESIERLWYYATYLSKQSKQRMRKLVIIAILHEYVKLFFLNLRG